MAQVENGNKEGNNDSYKREREGIKGVSDSVGESLRGNWKNVKDIWASGSQRQLGGPQAPWRASNAAERAPEAAEEAVVIAAWSFFKKAPSEKNAKLLLYTNFLEKKFKSFSEWWFLLQIKTQQMYYFPHYNI